MKCEYHRYALQSVKPLNAKESLNKASGKSEGFLFKFFFEDLNSYGYSSLHLHPSLGDETADIFEKKIRKNGLANLDFLIKNARIDAKGEALKLKSVVQSHYTANTMFLSADELKKLLSENGFTRIKIKIIPEKVSGNSFIEVFDHYQKMEIAKAFEFIFDFNLTGFEHEILVALNSESAFKYYLEDPTEFDLPSWERLIDNGAKILADQVDFEKVRDLALAGLVVKPTKRDLGLILEMYPQFSVLITSNMGETLDILTAQYWAMFMAKNHKDQFIGAGFLTSEFYQITPYINKALIQKTHDEGFAQSSGWGYRSFLKTLKWESLT